MNDNFQKNIHQLIKEFKGLHKNKRNKQRFLDAILRRDKYFEDLVNIEKELLNVRSDDRKIELRKKQKACKKRIKNSKSNIINKLDVYDGFQIDCVQFPHFRRDLLKCLTDNDDFKVVRDFVFDRLKKSRQHHGMIEDFNLTHSFIDEDDDELESWDTGVKRVDVLSDSVFRKEYSGIFDESDDDVVVSDRKSHKKKHPEISHSMTEFDKEIAMVRKACEKYISRPPSSQWHANAGTNTQEKSSDQNSDQSTRRQKDLNKGLNFGVLESSSLTQKKSKETKQEIARLKTHDNNISIVSIEELLNSKQTQNISFPRIYQTKKDLIQKPNVFETLLNDEIGPGKKPNLFATVSKKRDYLVSQIIRENKDHLFESSKRLNSAMGPIVETINFRLHSFSQFLSSYEKTAQKIFDDIDESMNRVQKKASSGVWRLWGKIFHKKSRAKIKTHKRLLWQVKGELLIKEMQALKNIQCRFNQWLESMISIRGRTPEIEILISTFKNSLESYHDKIKSKFAAWGYQAFSLGVERPSIEGAYLKLANVYEGFLCEKQKTAGSLQTRTQRIARRSNKTDDEIDSALVLPSFEESLGQLAAGYSIETAALSVLSNYTIADESLEDKYLEQHEQLKQSYQVKLSHIEERGYFESTEIRYFKQSIQYYRENNLTDESEALRESLQSLALEDSNASPVKSLLNAMGPSIAMWRARLQDYVSLAQQEYTLHKDLFMDVLKPLDKESLLYFQGCFNAMKSQDFITLRQYKRHCSEGDKTDFKFFNNRIYKEKPAMFSRVVDEIQSASSAYRYYRQSKKLAKQVELRINGNKKLTENVMRVFVSEIFDKAYQDNALKQLKLLDTTPRVTLMY